MLEVFCVCLVFRPLVSVYGLFPVLVSCNLVNSFQVCVICECVFKSCLLNSTSSGLLVIPGVSTRYSRCVYLALSTLDVVIKDYYFEVLPRLRVPHLSLLCAPWQLQRGHRMPIFHKAVWFIRVFLKWSQWSCKTTPFLPCQKHLRSQRLVSVHISSTAHPAPLFCESDPSLSVNFLTKTALNCPSFRKQSGVKWFVQPGINEFSGSEVKWNDVWPSMVTHTRNLCSAFIPSKCTHTVVNTHTHTHTHGEQRLCVHCVCVHCCVCAL